MTPDPDRGLLQLAPGTAQQLAIVYAPREQQAGLRALYLLDAEIRAAAGASSHEVAHAKLRFWREEADRLSGGRPTHPLTVELLASPGAAAINYSPLHECLAAADLDLARFSYSTRRELAAYAARSGGPTQVLSLALLAEGQPVTDEERRAATELGRELRLTEMLAGLQGAARHGRLYIPLDELDALGLAAGQVHASPTPATLAEWRCTQARLLGQSLQARLLSAPTRPGREELPGRVLAAQYLVWLERMRENGSCDLPLAAISPWRRAWRAWRTALSLRRATARPQN